MNGEPVAVAAAAGTGRIEVFVPGEAAPQGSKRHVGRGIMVESSKQVKPWRESIKWAVLAGRPPGVLLFPAGVPVRVRFDFVMKRPVSTPKRSTPPAVKRPDVDKLARAAADALSAVVWADDSQMVDLHATKRIAEPGETPGVHIVVAVFEAPVVAA